MLVRNDIYADEAGQCYRLLDVVDDQDQCWVIQLDQRLAMPEKRCYSLLRELEDASQIKRMRGELEASPRRPSPATQQRAKRAWQYIAPLINDPCIYDSAYRKKLITMRAAELPPIVRRAVTRDGQPKAKNEIRCSAVTLYSYLRAYWQGGQTLDALHRAFHKSGNSTKGVTAGRGRPSGEYDIYQLTDIDLNRIKRYIQRAHLGGPLLDLPEVRELLRRRYYSYVDGNGALHLKPDGQCPSLRQIRNVLYNHFALEERLRGRRGDKVFENDHDDRLGSARENCHGAGHIYEIDATVADVWLVASDNRSRIIGKPTLYLIYDRWSRLVPGFYVGLEPASWPAAMQAILSLVESKEPLCHQNKVPYDPEDWPAEGMLPVEIFGDRGEMASKASDRICDGAHTTVTNAPAHSPRRKGTVEVGFRLFAQSMGPTLLGYDPPTQAKRRAGKRYEKDACYTLDEFRSIIVRAIITHNRSVMPGYELDRDLSSAGIRPIPRELCAYSMNFKVGSFRRYEASYLRYQLLPQTEASITEEGIKHGDCFYTCREAEQAGWFLRATNRKRFRVTVSFDTRLVDAIYVHDPARSGQYFLARLTAKSRQYQGLSFAEVKDIQRQNKHLVRSAVHETEQARADLHMHIDKVSGPAHRQMKQQLADQSRSARRADTAATRFEERRARRQDEARITDVTAPIAAKKPATGQVLPFPASSSGEPSAGSAPTCAPAENFATPNAATDIAAAQLSAAASGRSTRAEKLRLKAQELLNDPQR